VYSFTPFICVMPSSSKAVDAYIKKQSPAVQKILNELRALIKDTVPDVEETMTYSMPAYKYHGYLVVFRASKNHYGLYTMNGSSVEKMKDILVGYETAKGTIRFPYDKPLPKTLIKKILKIRMKENLAKSK